MKKTPFFKIHEAMNAKMVSFAGFEMPLQYSGIIEEHNTVREKVGLFDVSHMGEFSLKGKHAHKLTQLLTCNDINNLKEQKLQYSCLTNKTGKIVDDLLVYKFNDNHYLMVVNASNIEKDWNWCNKMAVENGINPETTIFNISENTFQLAVQGPFAMTTLQKLTTEPILDMKPFTFKIIRIADVDNVLVSMSGYTGSAGCELYFQNPNDSQKLWDNIMNAGREFGIKPCGLGARDTLRIEAGFCLYGNDINESTSPLEARLNWTVKLNDGNDFIGREALENQKLEGIKRRLCGFEMLDRGIPRKDYFITNENGIIIGKVTSGTKAPYLNKAIGLGYINKPYDVVDNIILIRVREKLLKAKIVKLPFYKK